MAFRTPCESLWREALTLPEIERKYGARIDGFEPTHLFVILFEQRPVGWIQWYRWSDYPAHALQLNADPTSAGLDLAIGDASLVGKGIGSGAIRQFVEERVFTNSDITAIVCDPEEENRRSVRAFEKAGFTERASVQLQGENLKPRIMILKR